MILDTDTGKIMALITAKGKGQIVANTDITKIDKTVEIASQEDIIDISEVPKIEKQYQSGIKFYNNNVQTKDGTRLGKVIDYSIDTEFMQLNSIVVAKSFLKIIFWDTKIISYKDILEVTKNAIIVKNLVKPIKNKELRMAGASGT